MDINKNIISIIIPITEEKDKKNFQLSYLVYANFVNVEIIILLAKDMEFDVARYEKTKVLKVKKEEIISDLNFAIKMAEGNYISVVPNSSYVPISLYEKFYKVLKENDVDFVFSDFYELERNGCLKYKNIVEEKMYNRVLNIEEKNKILMDSRLEAVAIYKKKSIVENDILFNKYDTFLFQILCYSKRIIALNEPASVIVMREKCEKDLYKINKDYDFLKDQLIKDYKLWKMIRGIYTYRKFTAYKKHMQQIENNDRIPYLRRISAEFRRAKELDELNLDFFDQENLFVINEIMMNPDHYFEYTYKMTEKEKKYEQECERLKNELNVLKRSTTFKVGRIIMKIPCSIKDKLIEFRRG